MRWNRRILIVGPILWIGLILWILAGGRPVCAEPPVENPDWIPAEEAEDEPLLAEPAEEPLEPPLEEPVPEPAEEPEDMPVELPVEAPVELPKMPEPPKAKAPAMAKKPAIPRGETFRVRLAETGKGFRQGVAGQLRVTSSGLAFTREGSARADWSIAWKDLQAARKEAGLWDAPFVLGLVEHDGRKRFIARLDKDGRYLDGSPILAAIVRSGGAKFK